MNQSGIETITRLANFYGKWPGNYLKDLGYTPDLELQKQLLIQELGCSDLDEVLKELGWIKQIPVEKELIKRTKKVENIEDLVWNTPNENYNGDPLK